MLYNKSIITEKMDLSDLTPFRSIELFLLETFFKTKKRFNWFSMETAIWSSWSLWICAADATGPRKSFALFYPTFWMFWCLQSRSWCWRASIEHQEESPDPKKTFRPSKNHTKSFLDALKTSVEQCKPSGSVGRVLSSLLWSSHGPRLPILLGGGSRSLCPWFYWEFLDIL